jgi:hypothetical protein
LPETLLFFEKKIEKSVYGVGCDARPFTLPSFGSFLKLVKFLTGMFQSTSCLDFQIQDCEKVEDFSKRLQKAGAILAPPAYFSLLKFLTENYQYILVM